MSDRLFCGIGRERETRYGPMLKVSMSRDDLDLLMQNVGESGWVTFDVKRRKEVKDDKTHFCEIDRWKPEQAYNPPPSKAAPKEESDDLPF